MAAALRWSIPARPRARARLRERGLAPADVRVVPAAAADPRACADRRWTVSIRTLAAGRSLQTRAPAGRLDRRLAHGLRLPARPRCGAGPSWQRTTSLSRYPTRARPLPHRGRAVSRGLRDAVHGRRLASRAGAGSWPIRSRRLHVFTSRGRHAAAPRRPRRATRWATLAPTCPMRCAGAPWARWLERGGLQRPA
jgi:hypothetical protein